MSEEAPDELRLTINDEPWLMTRENAILFTFFGNIAMYNHVFLITGEEQEGGTEGKYLFETVAAQAGAYALLLEFMTGNDYPMVLNQLRVPDCDVNAYMNASLKDIGDYIPDDFLDNGTE